MRTYTTKYETTQNLTKERAEKRRALPEGSVCPLGLISQRGRVFNRNRRHSGRINTPPRGSISGLPENYGLLATARPHIQPKRYMYHVRPEGDGDAITPSINPINSLN